MSDPVWGVGAVESDVGLDALCGFREYCELRDTVSIAAFLEWAAAAQPPGYREGELTRLWRDGLAVLCAELLLELRETGCVRYTVILGDEREYPREVGGRDSVAADLPPVRAALVAAMDEGSALRGLVARCEDPALPAAWQRHLESLLSRLDGVRA